MSKSIPKPTPILQPSLIQYQNQGSKSIPRIQYRYLSRNQPVSPIPASEVVHETQVLQDLEIKWTFKKPNVILLNGLGCRDFQH